MQTSENRLQRLENMAPPGGRQFVSWQGDPWTLEQKAEAIRQHPEQRVFWRSLLAGEGRSQRSEGRGKGEEVRGQGEEVRGQVAEGRGQTMLDYAPHAAQMEIHRARGSRFRMVCTGRRFGKTLGLAAELLDRGGCEQGGDYAWVAPTYSVAERGLEAFRRIGYGFVQESGRAPCRVEFQGADGLARTRIWFLSADNPDNIRGFGFQGLVIDEAATIAPDVWHYVLRPTISQTLGWAMLVSTPKGRNWFYDLFTLGLDPAETDYKSFTFPSNASPFFPAQEWEDAKRIMNENAFRQEYMAEFMEDSAGVFRGIDACLIAECGMRNAECPRNVVIGCDVAKHTDFTVLIAMDADTGRCLAMERFNHLDWTIQKERIVAFCRKWRGRLILDATGVGDPIYDDLRRVLPEIEAVRFTTQTKEHLIQELQHAVEERKVSWPGTARVQGSGFGVQGSGEVWGEGRGQKAEGAVSRGGAEAQRSEWQKSEVGERSTFNAQRSTFNGDWEVLTAEMKRFEYDIRPGGGITYGAPSGYHDDCVIALALASHRRVEMMPYVGKMYVITGRNCTPSDGGYESEGRSRRWLFARRPQCVM